MADQDFNIKVVTTADTTGIKQTSSELDKLKTQQATFAETARRQAAAAQQAATPQVSASAGASLTGTAVGIGTIVSLLTVAINRWKEFNDGLDKAVEKMIASEEKMRALGESIVAMQDAAISARRIGVEPLEQSVERLTHDVAVLKVEQSLLDLPRQGDEWKKINAQIAVNEGLLSRVTAALKAQNAAKEKAAEKKAKDEQSFIQGAIGGSSPQTKAVLMNELAAQRAREAGDQRGADLYQKSAERFEKSMTPGQREELEGLRASTTKPVGRKAEVGESQDSVDEVERNRLNQARSLGGLPPLSKGQFKDQELLSEVKNLTQTMEKLVDIWR